MIKYLHHGSVLCLCLLGLAACSDVKRGLGFEHSGPDEFEVMSRPPLSLPPDYSLRPPRPGAKGPGSVAASDKAQKTLLGARASVSEKAGEYTAESSAEAALLGKAGADDARANIRAVVDAESGTDEVREDGFWAKLKAGRLLGDEGAGDGDSGAVLNPAQERERLAKEPAGELAEESGASYDSDELDDMLSDEDGE